ncbi:Uu.00g057450.m01.CDS01 [Anthostomella pinea]|uniref:Uu.00g057450.m01.CDS01 n=1 Tax=Anthostomella pinea TaxID=933095 RepID=A0AAI8YMA6_9PEZI|nr:Uu.00g057450.m01.CDS01 [Anthostomella pinea]
MPQDMQQAHNEAENKGVYDSPGYKDAMAYYFKKHVCRAEPFPPPEMLPTMKNFDEDRTVYSTMYGPSSLTMIGSLKDWTVIPRLAKINVPTLVYNGEFDTSNDIAQVPFFELIPRVRWVTLPGAGHMCHLEGSGLRERTLKLVGEFLTQKDIVEAE